jgi:hypothetical protein
MQALNDQTLTVALCPTIHSTTTTSTAKIFAPISERQDLFENFSGRPSADRPKRTQTDLCQFQPFLSRTAFSAAHPALLHATPGLAGLSARAAKDSSCLPRGCKLEFSSSNQVDI